MVLGGSFISCLGTTRISEGSDLVVVWLDAHADFDMPEDNLSGFLCSDSTLAGHT
jgi:arginase family enzyme